MRALPTGLSGIAAVDDAFAAVVPTVTRQARAKDANVDDFIGGAGIGMTIHDDVKGSSATNFG